MDKKLALRLAMCLSALESWAFATKNPLPDHMFEDIGDLVEELSKIILENKNVQNSL